MPPPLTEANLSDPVTQHMRQDVAKLRIDQTAGEALQEMRQQTPAGRIIYFYVVDSENRLQGVVPTRRLLFSPLDRPISEIMVRQVIAVPAEATVLDACEFFTLHRLLAFPVIDDEHRLLGVIDVELYTDELSEVGGTEDALMGDALFQLIGVHLTQARQTSSLAAFRSRFPWLLCNIAGGILAAFVSGFFEAELQRVVALALFIPVVLSLAESVSIQSVSLALEVLHGRPPSWLTMLPKLRRELLTGLLLGGASGLLVGIVALVWLGQVRVLLCLLGGIAGGVSAAAVLGIATPNLLRLLRRDPQVAAGPIALAVADMLTLLLYFNLARWLLA
jgi:magnesium transporter